MCKGVLSILLILNKIRNTEHIFVLLFPHFYCLGATSKAGVWMELLQGQGGERKDQTDPGGVTGKKHTAKKESRKPCLRSLLNLEGKGPRENGEVRQYLE